MSDKGNCFDNAAVETFFKSLKAEMLWRQATDAIFQYVNGFYNPRRRYSYLGSISPLVSRLKPPNKITYRHKTVTSPRIRRLPDIHPFLRHYPTNCLAKDFE